MEYVKQYHVDSAYIENQKTHESKHTYGKRVNNIMLYYIQAKTDTPVMRIQHIWPQEDWRSVWWNLHEAPIPTHP
jgi:hypothetical protein